MSRSYKKHPRCGFYKDKFYKRYANVRVRKNTQDILSHNYYKKLLSSYRICDYESFLSFQEYWKAILRSYNNYRLGKDPYPNKKEVYLEWYKEYKRK